MGGGSRISMAGEPRSVSSLYSELRELNPSRAAAFAREDSLLTKNMSIAHTQGNRLAARGGFDTGLSHLDHYRGRDPLRAFGSTRLEHEVMLNVAGTPVNDRRRAEMLRYVNNYSHMPAATTVEMLHDLRGFHGDSERLLRTRASLDPVLQPENKAAVLTQTDSARYTPSRAPVPGHHRYFVTG